eukprot:12288788-Ditylum_brightwellii.AAC.1
MTENDMSVNNIKIEGADGSQTKLKRFPPEEGIRMLGARHALTIQQETKLRHLKGKKQSLHVQSQHAHYDPMKA